MKRYALLALALMLGCSMLTGCGRREPNNGNMSTPPTEAARPTEPATSPVTEPVTMPSIPATEPDTMPATEPGTEETTGDATEPKSRGMVRDPIAK